MPAIGRWDLIRLLRVNDRRTFNVLYDSRTSSQLMQQIYLQCMFKSVTLLLK
jgi:hypothetical protein